MSSQVAQAAFYKRITTQLLKRTVFNNRLAALGAKQDQYRIECTDARRISLQLSLFNEMWEHAVSANPFYKRWKDVHKLPSSISNLHELREFPVLTKRDVQEHKQLILLSTNNKGTISTGGSTGEPAIFPKDSYASLANSTTYANMYTGRGWWNVSPLDPIFMIWGHSHLFGRGVKGWIKQQERRVADWATNTHRFSAYDMRPDTIGACAERFFQARPTAVLGYTSSVVRLATHLKKEQASHRIDWPLRAVIVTAETIDESDAVTIRHAFGAPVVIEYGLIEAGVVGYSRGETNTIQVLYDSFYCHADPTDGLILTTLWPRVFPLVNYDTNDKIVPKNEHDKSILSLARIVGRKHDVLNLVLGSGGNVAVHGEFFTHVMKNLEYVDSFRVQQRRSGREVKILVVVNERIHTEQISADIMTRITREFAVAPEYIKVEMVDSLDKTIAGKERWIEIID